MIENKRVFEIEKMIAELTRGKFPDGKLEWLTPEENILYALYHLSRLYSRMILGQGHKQFKTEAWTVINFVGEAAKLME